MAQHLPQEHPEVVGLLAQLQAQYENVGKVSSFVGFVNTDYLRTELHLRGWNTRLAKDGKTVVPFPVEEDKQ